MTIDSVSSTTLHELIRLVNWPEVKAALGWRMHVSQDETPPHRAVFRRLFTLEPEPSDLAIEITAKQSDDGSQWLDVGGRIAVPMADASPEVRASVLENGPDVTFALEFQPWTEWLGMTIVDATRANFTPAEIVAACVWEMSFFSFNESEIQGTVDYLKEEVESINKGESLGTQAVTLPGDNIFEAVGFPPEEAAVLKIEAVKRRAREQAGKSDPERSDDED